MDIKTRIHTLNRVLETSTFANEKTTLVTHKKCLVY